MPQAETNARSQILREATRLFAKKGYEGTSLQDLAEAVGMRKPSLLHHFASKDILHQAVLSELLQHWGVVLPKVLLAASSGGGQFEGVLDAMVNFFSQDPDRARLLMREILDRPDEMRALVRQHVQPWITVVADYIKKGQGQGRLFNECDPEVYAVLVVNLLVSTLAMRDLLKTMSHERAVAELVRIARSALFRPAIAVNSRASKGSRRKRPGPGPGPGKEEA